VAKWPLSGAKMASGNKAAPGSEVGRVYIYRCPLRQIEMTDEEIGFFDLTTKV
jgi:hypothetical protein